MSLQRLRDLDRSSAQFPDQLDKLLHDKEYVDGLLGLPQPELIQLVDHLNNVGCPSLRYLEPQLITITDPDPP